MSKRFALIAIRMFVSVNLLYAAIFLKFAGVPGSVALFTHMSRAIHGLVSQPVFRLGSGAFETVVAILFLIPKTARLAAELVVVWMTAAELYNILALHLTLAPASIAPALVASVLWVLVFLQYREGFKGIFTAKPATQA